MKEARSSFGWGLALIVLLTVITYIPALHGGFIWDDDQYVTGNPTLRSVEGLRQIWLNPDATVQYYPLTFTVFWIEYHLWVLQPFGFHLLNVLLHAANALLFWSLLSRLRVPGAWWAAAVFALHPVHVMSVAWITELKNVLSGLFYLGALLAYLQFCGLGGDPTTRQSSRRWFYVLAIGLYLCALLSKTATSVLPVAVLLILWWKHGRIGRKEVAAVLPFFVMAIVFGAFTLWLEKYGKGASGKEFTLPFVERLLVAGRSFWFCLGKLLWPAGLTFIYPRWQMDATSVWPYLFPLGQVLLLVTLWSVRRWVGRAPLAALVYFSLAFPSLVLVQVLYMMRFSFVSDHWQYLGSLSVIALAVGGAVMAIDRWSVTLRRVGPVIGTAIIVALGLLTWQQGRNYRNLETLWRDTLKKNPNAWIAHHNLGTALEAVGRVSEAKEHYEQALRLKPDYAEAHYNLGNTLLRLGRFQDAIAHYEQAVRLDPNLADAHKNLGFALLMTGRTGDAIAQLEEAVRLNPNFADAHNNLGSILLQLGRVEEAMGHCEQALRIRPDYAEAHNNLGNALLRSGKITEAIGQYEQALRLKPNYAEAHNNLGNALLQVVGRLEDATGHFEQATQLKPDFADAHANLGFALARDGKLVEAAQQWETALRLDPGNRNVRRALERVRGGGS